MGKLCANCPSSLGDRLCRPGRDGAKSLNPVHFSGGRSGSTKRSSL